MKQTKIILNEKDMPRQWYNVLPDLPEPLAPPLDPETKQPIAPEKLAAIFPMSLIEQEMSDKRWVDIPEQLLEIYTLYRPSPLVRAWRLEQAIGSKARIYYKDESVSPAGSHKPNTAVAQAYYNKMEGVKRLSTETGAGQWGTALSFACKMFDMDCTVYMVRCSYDQKPYRGIIIRTYGAEVFPSPSDRTKVGRQVLEKDPQSGGSLGLAISEAVEDAASNADTKYALGSVLNHVILHQTITGLEVKKQLEMIQEQPDVLVGCVGGGSNAAGMFAAFEKDADVKLIGVEAAGYGVGTGKHAASIVGGQIGILHGSKSYVLQSEEGQIQNAHSVSAGLDYPGVGPEHAHWAQTGRVAYHAVTDDEALDAFFSLTRLEGIIPALESSHALAEAQKLAKDYGQEAAIVINLSGRGDKDMETVLQIMKEKHESH